MKRYLYIFIAFISLIHFNFVKAGLQSDMLPVKWNKTVVATSNTWETPLNNVFKFIKDFLFDILWIIAVWVFLYFWFKLIAARWNPEEFKKVLMGFVYAIVWLAIIPLAWWAVKLVSSLSF